MELKSLTTFLVVAEVGTILHASKKLHCVQSNVTSRIKALEDELGVQLFQRSRNGMTLTAAGEVFLEHARAVVDQASMARDSVVNFSTRVSALRIGSMESSLAARLPAYISDFRQSYPEVRISLKSAPTEELVKALLGNRLDVAFIGGFYRHKDIDSRIAFTEEMVLATPAHCPGYEEVGSSPIIVFRHGCSYRLYTESWMKRAGLGPNEIIELGTLDGILGCVASGIGVTILPRSVVENCLHRKHLRVYDLPSGDRFMDTVAITNKRCPGNGALDAFLDRFKQAESALAV